MRQALLMIRGSAAWLVAGLLGLVGPAGLASCASDPAPQAPAHAAVKAPTIGGMFSPAGDRHPGHIYYEDRVEHRTWTRNAFEVPATLAWVKVHDRWVAVVWIEIDGHGQHREITTYGPDHQPLERTTARLSRLPPRIAPPPPPAPARPPVPVPEPE